MKKAEAGRAFWATFGLIYIGGILLYFGGVKPRNAFSREVIPVDEPTALDWVQVGGMMFFT